MSLFTSIEKITHEQATDEQNAPRLMGGDVVAWKAPMSGAGAGASPFSEALPDLLALYCDEDALDVTQGPDEIIFLSGGEYYLMTITVQ